MFGRTLSCAVFVALLFSVDAWATELQICSMDASVTLSKSATTTITDVSGMEGTGAKQITIATSAGDQNPYVWKYISDATAWKNYEGVKFWVKGNTAADNWGVVDIVYDNNYYHVYAGFEITTSWTEISIPWREFVQRNYQGTINQVLQAQTAVPTDPNQIQAIGFVIKPIQRIDTADIAQPLIYRGPVTFSVDDLRLTTGITLTTTPVPSSVGLPRSAAKVALGQPLKILILGDSISYGTQLNGATRLTDRYSALIQTMLNTALAPTTVTVVNAAIGGKEYWEYACNITDIVKRESPDLIITEFMINDTVSSGGPADQTRIAQFRDNVNKSLDIFLRYDQADVAVMVPSPPLADITSHAYDPWAAQLEAAIGERNLLEINVYDHFMTFGTPATLYAGDSVHPNAAGHQEIADVVYNTILPYLQNGDGEAPTVTVSKAVLYGTVSDGVSPLIQMTVNGVSLGNLTGAWTSQEVTLNVLPASTTIPVVGTDASSNARTVNVTVGP